MIGYRFFTRECHWRRRMNVEYIYRRIEDWFFWVGSWAERKPDIYYKLIHILYKYMTYSRPTDTTRAAPSEHPEYYISPHLESIYTKVDILIYDSLLECWVGVYCNIWKRKECNPRLLALRCLLLACCLEIHYSLSDESTNNKYSWKWIAKDALKRAKVPKKNPDSSRFLNINGIPDTYIL